MIKEIPDEIQEMFRFIKNNEGGIRYVMVGKSITILIPPNVEIQPIAS